MTSYDPPRPVVRAVVQSALAEDLGVMGDVTSLACIDPRENATAVFVARDEGVLAGTALATETFAQLDANVAVEWQMHDGEAVRPGAELGRVSGSLQSILTGERTALNFLSHCSGIASLTRRYVDATRGKARIRDTRKTIPGLRAVQKAAVRAGGGFNHRDSLSDAILIKDNHLAVLGVTRAVDQARTRWPGRTIEVECDTLDQVVEARDAGVELALVDNMSPSEVQKAVALAEGTIQIEVSGRVALETVAAYAESGADFISVGAITHSAPVLDIGLDLL
jgi:nicotinate-nucleotide pyrophosphorylase (carboxylating)